MPTEATAGTLAGNGGTPNGVAPAATAPQAAGGLNGIDWNTFDPAALPRSVIERHPDFNGLRSAMDKRLSATEQRYQRQLQEAQQSSRLQMEQLQQVLGSRLDDGTKRELQNWETTQKLQSLERENQALRAYYGRQAMLSELSSKHGIPLDELADVEEPTQAYEKIVGHQAATLAQLQKQVAELTARFGSQSAAAALPVPDLGAGESTNTLAYYQTMYDDAMRKRDSALADKIQFEAMDQGHDLDLMSFRKKV